MSSWAVELACKHFQMQDNHLVVGGKSIVEWAEEFGTPLYLYDVSVVRKKIALFREVMPAEVYLYYAIKANPFPDLLRQMVPLVDGFDVASAGELDTLVNSGANPKDISFAGPGKRRNELVHAVKVGIGSINLESQRELDLSAEIGKEIGEIPKVSIRINPDFELHGSGMKMGGGSKQFGIDAEEVPRVLEKTLGCPVDFQGFHIYAGSQNLQAQVICQAMEKSLELMWHVGKPIAGRIYLLNLGGGFGIPYYEKDRELDILTVGKYLKRLVRKYRPRFPAARFVIELGRFLTGECGIYLTRILYRKVSRGKTYLVTDGGMNHHLAASGNFGQVLRRNFPIVLANRMNGSATETVDIVGPLCTPLDLLGSKLALPVAKEGDLIAIMNSGAYGFSASPLFFLGHPAPSQILA